MYHRSTTLLRRPILSQKVSCTKFTSQLPNILSFPWVCSTMTEKTLIYAANIQAKKYLLNLKCETYSYCHCFLILILQSKLLKSCICWLLSELFNFLKRFSRNPQKISKVVIFIAILCKIFPLLDFWENFN